MHTVQTAEVFLAHRLQQEPTLQLQAWCAWYLADYSATLDHASTWLTDAERLRAGESGGLFLKSYMMLADAYLKKTVPRYKVRPKPRPYTATTSSCSGLSCLCQVSEATASSNNKCQHFTCAPGYTSFTTRWCTTCSPGATSTRELRAPMFRIKSYFAGTVHACPRRLPPV